MLYEGQVLKGYKDLCEEMRWKVYKSGSNSYKSQMKELDTRCRWHKEERAFVIDEVYAEVLVKKDNRRSKALYIEDIKKILLYTLMNCETYEYMSINNLINTVGMFNENYNDETLLINEEELLYELEASKLELMNFRIDAKREAQRILCRALSSLKSQNIIQYEYGRVILTSDYKCRFADANENRLIQMAEEEQLEEIKLKSKVSLKYKNAESTFYNGVYKKLLEVGIKDVKRIFYGYKFISYNNSFAETLDKDDDKKAE